MAPFHLSYDRDDGIVSLRIARPLTDIEAVRLTNEIVGAIGTARRDWGVVRILFDNRETAAFTGPMRDRLIAAMAAARRPGDRTALLVGSSVMKAHVKKTLDEATQAFLSPSAARTWLDAWVGNGPYEN